MAHMEQMEQKNTGVGNTKTPVSSRKSRLFFFTWNNYTDKTIIDLKEKMIQWDAEYLIGEEVGEQGTPHLQGCFKVKNPRTWESVAKSFQGWHLELSKKWKEALLYCMKDNKFFTNISTLPVRKETNEERCLKSYTSVVWKDWQQNVIDIISSEPDNRSIHWFVDPSGNTGKSFLAKYLVLKYDAIIASGKKADIFNQIKIWLDKWEGCVDPKVIILDVPRSYEHVNYGAIEEIKNGLLYSGKYEGGRCVFASPHVFVFSNAEPDRSQWSTDRLHIYNI